MKPRNAQIKGEYEAVRVTAVEKNCNIASKSPDELMESARIADEAQKEVEESELSGKLKELEVLKEDGAIKEEEYQAARKSALGISE